MTKVVSADQSSKAVCVCVCACVCVCVCLYGVCVRERMCVQKLQIAGQHDDRAQYGSGN